MYMKRGQNGEELACAYLVQQNYQILERNFTCKQGEIDIIAFDNKNKELVFVEVKSRTSSEYGLPSEAVGKIKKRHVIRVAKYYCYIMNLYNSFIRFDVIEIFLKQNLYTLNHIKQAF